VPKRSPSKRGGESAPTILHVPSRPNVPHVECRLPDLKPRNFVSCKHSGASEITPQSCMKRHCFICFEGEGHRMRCYPRHPPEIDSLVPPINQPNDPNSTSATTSLLRQPSQSSNHIPIQPNPQSRLNHRRKQARMINRQILAQPVLPLSLVPLLRRCTPIHKETVRLPNSAGQDAEILTPGKLRDVHYVPFFPVGEVLAERLLEFSCQVVVVDCQGEGAGCLEGWRLHGISSHRFGFDDAFD
jgi:hypothetical protein